ncbi:MAG: hypothetical protein Q4E13_08155 [Clostridia bacterium]|nr:hypothetical protein [Clostridia bacterium]
MQFVIYECAKGAWFVLEDEARRGLLVSRLFRNVNWCRIGMQAVIELMHGKNMRRKTAASCLEFKDQFSEYVYVDSEGLVRLVLITGMGNVLAESRAYPTLNAYNEEIASICREIRNAPQSRGRGEPTMQPASRTFDEKQLNDAAERVFLNAAQ